MKKSNTLFTLAFFAILAFSSCEREQWGNAQKGPDDIDNRAEGQIGLSALKVSVDEQTATTVIIRKSKCSRVSKRKVHFTKRSV